MAFTLTQPKQISQWVDYIDGDIKAKIKVRGIKYEPYTIASERVDSLAIRNMLKIEGVGAGELSHQDMLFKTASEYLIEDWQEMAIEKNGEVADVPYTKDIAFQMMAFGGEAGVKLYLFVLNKARQIQAEADAYKEEILGKSLNSIDGQKLAAAKKQKSETK